jgi:hypothetical protein
MPKEKLPKKEKYSENVLKKMSKKDLIDEIIMKEKERAAAWWHRFKLCDVYLKIMGVMGNYLGKLPTELERFIVHDRHCILECPICTTVPECDNNHMSVAPCGHLYCKGCLVTYKKDFSGCKRCGYPLESPGSNSSSNSLQ